LDTKNIELVQMSQKINITFNSTRISIADKMKAD
jgi:hypothetical protein